MACLCEVTSQQQALADHADALASALARCAVTFGDIVNLLNPESYTYDTRLATVQRVVALTAEGAR